MLLIIFGAGASFDSDPSRPAPSGLENRPPLANQLFDDRHNFVAALCQFDECAEIVPFLRGAKAIEQQLEVLQNEANEYPDRFRQLAAARWYLQFMLGECGD